MLTEFAQRTRCHRGLTDSLAAIFPPQIFSAVPPEALLIPGANPTTDLSVVADYYRLEQYQQQGGGAATAPGSDSLVRQLYYLMRPFLPVALRKHLQRLALRGWQDVSFPRWPVDTTVEDLEEAVWLELLRINGAERLPFVWYWPEGYRTAVILTHDVETATGRDFCGQLMKMEAEFGLNSAFEVVPEDRYEVPDTFLQSLRDGGCEVALHGLNHDGHLFDSEREFRLRAERINHYLQAWEARGFRSPIMYRRQKWLHHLDIAYDMSVPNSARLDPQRGGCCTVRPYFVNSVLELPLTTIQDYSLLAILNDPTPTIWWQQLAAISAVGGLASFIVHPDYVIEPRARKLYQQLLVRLTAMREAGDAWIGLPGELNDWWRQRQEMTLVEESGKWSIRGTGAERARVAWAVRHRTGIQFEVES